MKGFYCAIFVLLCLIWGNCTCKGSRHQLSDSHVAFNEVIRIINCSLHISASYICNICTTDFTVLKILATDFDCASFQCSMVYMFACRKGLNCLPWMIFVISPSPLILFILPTKHLTILMNQFQVIVDDYIDVLLRDAAI